MTIIIYDCVVALLEINEVASRQSANVLFSVVFLSVRHFEEGKIFWKMSLRVLQINPTLYIY